MQTEGLTGAEELLSDFDWNQIAYFMLVSRTIDRIEETRLVPEGRVLYQFSAAGHELAQILLGFLLNQPHDAVSAYYRSRPILLSLGVDLEDAIAGPMGKSGGYSDGRDIGVVCNRPGRGGPTILPMAGDVGSQFTPAAGWAQAIRYRHETLQEASYAGCIAAALGGDGAVATSGFWAALNIATTLRLPLLFLIEDNGFGISVPAHLQTPGGNIAQNLAAFRNLKVNDGDGTDPVEASSKISDAVAHVRAGQGPALIRLEVPRLSGHSVQDTQTYKSAELLERERASDPLKRLRQFLVPSRIGESDWQHLEEKAEDEVERALEKASARPDPDPSRLHRHVFLEKDAEGRPELQVQGGLAPEGHLVSSSSSTAHPEPTRINMVTAIRRTLEHELATNPKLLLFGEDVGRKGGVHAATVGLHQKFGDARVFDTSLSEEGIVGRAVGLALAGLMPVAEIQFRKYADPATEQLNNCGTIRWRTVNRFAAPVVVRVPGGFAKCGDPWHSVCGEVFWAHAIGWQVAFPSNAEDAVGLLRMAMRSDNPTIFFEHRALLDLAWARRPYPGDQFTLPFGQARLVQAGDGLTVVTWGAMVERCVSATREVSGSVEVIDLRTLLPWDQDGVIASVKKTRRCLIVHEDTLTAGFGAEIAAVLAKEAFFDLDAPVERVAMPDIPVPYNVDLMNSVLPGAVQIAGAMRRLMEF